MTLPEITEIQRWQVKPGDRLLAYVNRDKVSHEEAREITAHIRASLKLPDLIIVIVTREWDFAVMGVPSGKDAARGES
jgi:hypothetical protein